MSGRGENMMHEPNHFDSSRGMMSSHSQINNMKKQDFAADGKKTVGGQSFSVVENRLSSRGDH